MEDREDWIAGHLHYHQDLTPALFRLVAPLVGRLARAQAIDSFFFVRYSLGGPHLRLRLRLKDLGRRTEVGEAMAAAAAGFLAAEPSQSSWDDEKIRSFNERVLAGDPNEKDAAIYPDNFFRFAPFVPEVERYGGTEAMAASLQVFCLSSIAALRFAARFAGDAATGGARLAEAMRLLFFQALGFASSRRELADLLRYGVDSFGSSAEKIIEKGKRVAASQADLLQNLNLPPLFAVPGEARGERELLFLGSRCLSRLLSGRDSETRARIGGSQLHMTASRLGINNIEEVYLSSLLGSALENAEPGLAESLLEPPFKEGDALAEDPLLFLGQLVSSAQAP